MIYFFYWCPIKIREKVRLLRKNRRLSLFWKTCPLLFKEFGDALEKIAKKIHFQRSGEYVLRPMSNSVAVYSL